MATPTENASILRSYWTDGAKAGRNLFVGGTPSSGWAGRLVGAMRAMNELVQQAGDPYVRRTVFAPGSIFETALIAETAGPTDALLAMGWVVQAVLATGDAGLRPPRLIMLEKIHTLVSGGWWGAVQPTGVTDWLKSVAVSASAMQVAITSDPNLAVRKAATWLVEDRAVGIPVYWAENFMTAQVFPRLEEQLKTATWPQADRIELTKLAASAQGRVGEIATKAALANIAMTGDGQNAPTAPPKKPWYRNGPLWAASSLGLVAGVVTGARKHT